ncbi:MAG TPA: hypothetical protein VGT02_03240 [Methylomirabilota bacterium]|jgi:hypothetical protein|nr:hypothetical protein [Methylomirabilota bacterium]
MRRTAIWFGGLACLVASAVTEAQPQRPAAPAQPVTPADMRAATQAAQNGLTSFAQLVTRENFQAMGFTRPDEVRSAVLGPPLPEFMVRLDELRAFQRGHDPLPLLHPNHRMTFPVRVANATRSALTVERRGTSWNVASYGAPRYGALLDATRDRLARQESRDPAEYFEVRVPALNVSFVGARRDGRIALTPLVDDARFGFRAGGTLPAGDAFLAMVPAAQRHNGLPS